MNLFYKQLTKRHKLRVVCSLCLFGLFAVWSIASRYDNGNRAKQKKEDITKVYLLHSDELKYNQAENPEAQILTGHVAFRHDNVKMFCDSAHFYQGSNSFEAFGHVKLLQGDTLSLKGDYLYYDGNSQIAQVRKNVVMKHHKTILLTDSLNYDRVFDLGYFFEGGKLYDNGSVLTSEWGEYSPATKLAVFNYNVKLESPKFILTSDTLHYNTQTKLAHIVGPSNIVSGDNNIYSESGYYNTSTGKVNLLNRSIVANKGKRMIGDSLFYDKEKGIMEAFKNVIYEDKVGKNALTGNYCYNDEVKGFSLVTDRALIKDFSGKDTLYMHADTLKSFTFNIKTDSVYRVMHAYRHVRSFRTDMQSVCDSLIYNTKFSKITMYENPIVWTGNQQVLGEEINVFLNDSTLDSIQIDRQALLVERMDSIHYNQIAGREMRSYFEKGELKENHVNGNVLIVYYPLDSDSTMNFLNYAETSKLKMYMQNKKMKRIWTPEVVGTLYPLLLIPKDKLYLANFAWFDYIRPLSKEDLFEWRGKKKGTELKQSIRREVPLQNLNTVKK
ncbi:MAG: OstA-like protein [Bacteroidaceae bacterium]